MRTLSHTGAGAEDPEAVCAALAPLLGDERRQRIESVIDARLASLTVLVENLHDPRNGAAVLRSAEAFGLQVVHVVEAAERFRFSPTVSQGCEKWLDVERHPTFACAEAGLRAAGFALYAAVPDATVSLEQLDFTRPAAVLVGNEHDGLTAEAARAADVRFTIPMAGMTRSFNLSVAAAVTLAQATARRRAALGRAGDLDERARLVLRARFYAASVRGAEEVVARFTNGGRAPVEPSAG